MKRDEFGRLAKLLEDEFARYRQIEKQLKAERAERERLECWYRAKCDEHRKAAALVDAQEREILELRARLDDDPERNYETLHELKCWPLFFRPLLDGRKTFEVRKNDRGFRPGDCICLREWDPDTEKYTGQSVWADVTYVLAHGIGHGTYEGVAPGFVVLGIKILRTEARE